MMNNIQDKEITVDILMPTYNHEKYIAQAIQSVLMQECSYHYRLIIGEDCSSDNTRKICEGYASENPDRILLLKNSTNLGIAANYQLLFNSSTAKYVAILEGDDYWIDTNKLQKQVEILETNPAIGLVHTNYYSLFENNRMKIGHLWSKENGLSGNVIGPTQTVEININPLTTCFRSSLVKENVDFDFIKNNHLLTVDIFLWAEICRRSEVSYIHEATGVYRIHQKSITGNRYIESIEKFNTTSFIAVDYLMQKYSTPVGVKEAFYSRIKLNLIYAYILAGQSTNAKLELQHVKIITTLKDRIIYVSAKYKSLNFLCKIMNRYYNYGSLLKQWLGRIWS